MLSRNTPSFDWCILREHQIEEVGMNDLKTYMAAQRLSS